MTVLGRAAEILGESRGDLSGEIFSSWNRRLFDLYRRAEEKCFIAELLYSEEELQNRSDRRDFEVMILSRSDETAALLMVYLDDEPDVLYLDTLAVVNPGEKLGVLLVRSLIRAAEEQGFKGIGLDTERINGRGQKLVEFYTRLGFSITGEEESGNIRMDLRFTPKRP